MADQCITLDAYSLGSKFGFEDGDLVSEVIFDAWGFDEWEAAKPHEVLVALVRKHLLPLLPGVEVIEIGTCHNPIRATEKWADFVRASSISVDVPISEVLGVAREMERQANIAPTPDSSA